tara:strand:- start:688 stop:1800 length:1113 start_codon:yes stop_codon:yes gene_type:complete
MITKKINKFLNIISRSAFWDIKTTLITFLLVQLVTFPSYSLEYKNWSAQYEKSSNIFSNIDRASGYSHKAKINVRITVPILIRLLDLSPMGLILFKNITGIIFIFLILKLFFLITDDKNLSILLTFSCAFVGFGKASTIDPSQIFDGLSLTLVLLSFLLRNPILIILCLVCGFFNDERTIISAFLFALYYFQFKKQFNNKHDNKYPLITFLSFIIFIVGRAYMQFSLSMEAPIDGVGFKTFLSQINAIGMSYFMFLEGFWIIIIYALYFGWNTNKKNPLFILTAISFFIGSFASFFVIDHGRSLYYSYPIIFFGLSYLKPLINDEKFKSLILATLISCMLIPTVGFGGKSSYWSHYSLPTQIIRMITNKY